MYRFSVRQKVVIKKQSHIQDVIDRMSGTLYWTTLDAASAYWSIPLNEIDRENTAFNIPGGKYQFTVTPYGLCNAGASYQRMYPPDRTLAYMDDIIIFSKTWDSHIFDLINAFERMRTANISLQFSKCLFGSDCVDFLGYHLTQEGIKPKKNLLEAIMNFPKPENRKEVKRFLGMTGFSRSFVKDFSEN